MSTIIKQKTFPKFKSWTMDLCGRPLTIEVGKVAELASASALVKYGETTVLVAVTVSRGPGRVGPLSPRGGVAAGPAGAVRVSPPSPPCWPAASSTGPCAPCSPTTSATTCASSAPS